MAELTSAATIASLLPGQLCNRVANYLGYILFEVCDIEKRLVFFRPIACDRDMIKFQNILCDKLRRSNFITCEIGVFWGRTPAAVRGSRLGKVGLSSSAVPRIIGARS